MKAFTRNSISTSAGFSLVELAIVLVIIGLISGSSLMAINNQMAAAKKTQTLTKMQTIEQALAAYLALNNHLPCPALPGLMPDSPQFGLEYCMSVASKHMGIAWIIEGTVPTRALQLPDEFIYDGWEKHFTYALTFVVVPEYNAQGYGGKFGPVPQAPFPDVTPFLTVKDAGGGIRTDKAIYVLVSHGPNGLGARGKDGRITTTSSNPDERMNGAHAGQAFDGIFVQREANNQFDDIVRYKTKPQMVQAAGAVLSNSNCKTASNIIDQTIVCGGTGASPDCNSYLLSLAKKVNSWCVQ